ncbi:SNF1-interacting protein [Coemansia sp. RSA 2050]|nr:SNF1-interacting protein [Coemansia sp. RSA 2050]
MGNAAGKLNGAMVCDGGGLAPTGIYAEDTQDYDVKVVQRLILGRQMAPFYTGADEPDPAEPPPGTENDLCKAGDGAVRASDDGWWSYNLMVAQQAQKSAAATEGGADPLDTSLSRQMSATSSSSAALHDTATDSVGSHPPSPGFSAKRHVRKGSGFFQRLKAGGHRSPGGSTAEPPKSLSPSPTVDSVRHGRSVSELSQQQQQQPVTGDAAAAEACRRLLRRYIECPICFLYYPQNTNYTRCCHKPICTECFVQIKRRIEESCIAPTHCPYCVEPNLGIVYYPPGIITGAARSNYMKHRAQLSSNLSHGSPNQLHMPRLLSESGRARSYTSADGREPAIVMTDDIRPARMRELNATLQARHREQLRSAENMALVAAATRRASARQLPESQLAVLSPQFSSLLPPPPPSSSLPSSRRLLARSPAGATDARQPPSSAAGPEYVSYITAMHAAGRVDLEEFLVQEAIRQSLADQETAAAAAAAAAESGASHSEPATETDQTTTPESPSDTNGEQQADGLSVAGVPNGLGSSDHHYQGEAAGSAPLVLAECELDAIASVTSRPRPTLSSVATSPVLTVVTAAPSPDDLMSFPNVDVLESEDIAASSMMTLRSPSSPSGRPLRRRPPPPPPPQQHSKQQQSHSGADDATQTQPPLILL